MKFFITLKLVLVLVFFCSSPFSQAVWSQQFSSIDTDLKTLENLIRDTIANTEEQQRLLYFYLTKLNILHIPKSCQHFF